MVSVKKAKKSNEGIRKLSWKLYLSETDKNGEKKIFLRNLFRNIIFNTIKIRKIRKKNIKKKKREKKINKNLILQTSSNITRLQKKIHFLSAQEQRVFELTPCRQHLSGRTSFVYAVQRGAFCQCAYFKDHTSLKRM